jgi:SAM-dependent methyltransferase
VDDGGWRRSPAMLPLVRELRSSVVGRYRVDEDTAGRLVDEALARDRRLRRLVEAGLDAAQLRRTAEFRAAATAARRHAYHQLRRYRRQGEDPAAFDRWSALAPAEREDLLRRVAAGHVSALERLESLQDVHDQLFARVGSPRTVLDVGCGRYPLLFPFDAEGWTVERYVAVDRDPASIGALQRYAAARGDGRLVPVRADVAGGWGPVLDAGGVDRFDLALLLKAVPVLQRLRRRTLVAVREVPADLVVLTGSVESMTRRRRIDRRERRTLLRFVEGAGWRVVDEFRTADEVGLVAAVAAGGPAPR